MQSATNSTSDRQLQETWADKAWRHWPGTLFSDLKLTDVDVAIFTGVLAYPTIGL